MLYNITTIIDVHHLKIEVNTMLVELWAISLGTHVDTGVGQCMM